MIDVDALRERLREWMKVQNTNVHRLKPLIKISEPTLYHFLDGSPIYQSTARKIKLFLDEHQPPPIEEFLRDEVQRFREDRRLSFEEARELFGISQDGLLTIIHGLPLCRLALEAVASHIPSVRSRLRAGL